MDLKNLFGGFFTREAGQRRRAWLEDKEKRVADKLRYALGPQLYPRADAVLDMAALFSPGQDVIDAKNASADLMDWNGPLDAAADTAGLVAAFGSMMLPGGVSSYRQGFDDLVDEGMRMHKSGRVNMFAGPSAKTADLSALDRARALQAKGVDRDAIWRDTGWFRGVDGNWRFEIDDSQASVSLPPVSVPGEIPNMKLLKDTVQHDDLHAAYPALGDTGVFSNVMPGFRGQIEGDVAETPNSAMMTINPNAGHTTANLLHETQHGIQSIEGFARGGTPVTPEPGTPEWDLFEEIWNAEGAAPMSFEVFHKNSGISDERQARAFYDEHIANVPARSEREVKKEASKEGYKRLAGEVEARNVETRRNMNAAERRATPPWQTQDRTDAQQIVRIDRSSNDDLRDYLASLMR